MRGRPPKPTALKRLEGWRNKGPRSIQEDGIEPEPPLGSPEEPERVKSDPIAHAEWEDVCRHLDSMGLLATTDKMLIATYCIAVSDWSKAIDMVRQYGEVVVVGKSKYMQSSPYANARNTAFQQIKACLDSMGLTPAARARMRVAGPKKEDTNPWAKLIA